MNTKARVPARPEEIEGHGREVLAHSNPREEDVGITHGVLTILTSVYPDFQTQILPQPTFILHSSQSYTSLANPLQVS